MAENKLLRGVVVEFDFTALDGSQILFDTARKLFGGLGVELDVKREALHLAGGNYQGGITELFASLDKEGDAQAVARNLAQAFSSALTARVADGVTPDFKAFVQRLASQGVKTVIATRADISALRPLLEGLNAEMVVPYAETSSTYGNCKWDAWRRACGANGLHEILAVGVAGSGAGVKSALVAGLSALAVIHDHVAYQDFGGADAVVEKLDASAADEALRMLHLA